MQCVKALREKWYFWIQQYSLVWYIQIPNQNKYWVASKPIERLFNPNKLIMSNPQFKDMIITFLVLLLQIIVYPTSRINNHPLAIIIQKK